MVNREINVCQQTWALLCKNLLRKWRMKRDTFWEFLYTSISLFSLSIFPEIHNIYDFSSLSNVDLGRIDSFNDSTFLIAYTPVTETTQRIMNRVSLASYMTGKEILAFPDEENMTELISNRYNDVVRVIFTSTYSYHLKFHEGIRIPTMKEHKDHTAHCSAYEDDIICDVSRFWTDGFVALQAAINSAIIEITTNHSVMEEMMSVTGKYMKIDPFIAQGGITTDSFLFLCIICFSPLTYYISAGVTRERKKMKGLMTVMGLQDSAFWLSWGLLYGVIVLIVALLLTFIIKLVQFVILTGFMMIFSLFFFYGLSLISLSFLMSVLLRKLFLTDFVVFFLTVFSGSLGFTALYRYLPVSLEWVLSLLSPFAFMLGMAQLLHLDYDVNSNANPQGNPNLIIATIFMLFFDSVFYLILTFYFEKVLPNEYGRRHPPLFFLKSSFWSQQNQADQIALDNETADYEFSDDLFEPVSTEFHGKEAIRIRSLTKEYIEKSKRTEALKDLALDIYKGQITAILGHSGAGKSTLLNVLSGLCVPTKGCITIYDNKLSEMTDLENIIKLTGICPQCNVQFDFLTVRENLRLFAKIKGIQAHEVDNEIQRVLMELEMRNIQDILAQNLSGGQKRKLTFGIALLGDPQIFLLDEPTAGLDPFSRHRVWNVLKERKADRVVLFSTQFMDEADILADRKVFISKGKLKCVGSSLFLKKKWGIGYHLSLQLNETCVHERITSLVKQHIPECKLSAKSEGNLNYILPLERTNKFPDLYRDLERCPDLGIENYGVSITTLNEVFLKLEGKSTIDQSDVNVSEAAGTRGTGRLAEMEQLVSLLNAASNRKGGMALWWQQLCAVVRLRFLKLKHERKSVFFLILILGIGLLHILSANIHRIVRDSDYCWELSPYMYFLSPGQQPHEPLTNLLIINKTGAQIDDFIHSLEKQNISLDVDAFGTRNGTEETLYNGAIILSGGENNYNFMLVCNTKRLNCFPVLVDIVSNGLLGLFTSSAHIQTDRSTFPEDNSYGPFFHLPYFFSCILVMASVPPYISMTSIDDYKNRAQLQLWISGLCPSAYWFGQALVEVPIYWALTSSMYVAFYASAQESILATGDLFIQMLYVGGYAMSIIFMTYVISFIYHKGRKNSGIWSLCFYFVTLFSIYFMILGPFPDEFLFCAITLIPPATLAGCTFLHLQNSQFYDIGLEESSRDYSFLLFLVPFLHFAIFLAILRCLESKLGMKTMGMDPVFRISSRSGHVFNNPEEPEGEDEDVRLERVRTASALTSADFQEKPAIIASCLRKEYRGKKKCFVFKSKKKIATRNISFCVRKGEIVGLLGHNGAGKSTSIKMITGEAKPSAGQVLLKGNSTGDTLGFLGYCPQENALWPSLTVREHLEIFAAMKGMSRGDAAVAIARLADVLKLQEQMKAPVKTLSEGVKRKLCFMLSILGNPSVVLLDEPSTGMDPEGQQQIWKIIRAIFTNTERGALLTTHYMAEAEAVCDRVAIMVSGRLRCIGSIQHLKSKFGKDYLLEMKVKTLAQVEPINTEIMRLFPQAARQERYSSLMVYKLPKEDVQPLSQAFFKLETVKQSFDLEEYSLSQSTLEQVFLELSKEQELDGFEEELDPSVKWKLLPQEEA
ncbi:ABC-type organic anion transporter ABCA8A-like isoform X3 [Peromyscus maniculatus bairdii]|uniref:ATP-binding cassette, sub-family A member 8a n=2 Tax=Peromyscus maniculatus bairdii TaxID=230844 RepID=A0A6I9KZC5_PERMB|nr:ABC-type organic anion transporter ABCA8A-like isoform X1 [Peromyscus maniculatus bairdii]